VDKNQFLKNFEVVVDSPNGIQQLRKIIFDLAVQGELIIQKHELSKSKSLSPVPRKKIRDVARVFNGDSTSAAEKARLGKTKSGVPYIATKDINYGFQPVDYQNGLFVEVGDPKYKIAPKGSVLICLEGGSAGKKMALLDRDSAFGNKLFANVCNEDFNPKFLLINFLSSSFQSQFKAGMSGIIGGISKARFVEIEIAAPPIDQQEQIVNRVESLLAMCDELEVESLKRKTLRTAALSSAIDAVSAASSKNELTTAWKRISAHWNAMADSPESVDALRSLILELAIKGKLVMQQEEDGTAADLLKEIQVERDGLPGRSTNSRIQHRNIYVEPYPEIPQNWVWTSLSEIGIISPRNSAEDHLQTGFIPMNQISERFAVSHTFDIRPWREIKRGYTHVQNGDVVVAKITPCFENGKAAVIEGLPNSIGAGTTEIHVVRPILVRPEYILVFLNSPFFVENGIPKMTGTAGQKRLPLEHFSMFPFPLPPIAEQIRIVEKVDTLMSLCEELETSLRLRLDIESAYSAALAENLSSQSSY